jgi:hypothetical protein
MNEDEQNANVTEEVTEDQNQETEGQTTDTTEETSQGTEEQEDLNAEGEAEGGEAEDGEEEEESEDETDWTQYIPQGQNIAPPTPDENGVVDIDTYNAYVREQSRQDALETIKFARSEERAWKSVEKKHPVFKNPELRKVLLNQRLADVQAGGDGDLDRIAGDLGQHFTAQKNEGRTQERTSQRVQKTAALAGSGPAQVGDDSGEASLQERMQSDDPAVARAARVELLTGWQKSGKL